MDKPALVIVDGVGIGRAIVQELGREMAHLLPGGSFDDQNVAGQSANSPHFRGTSARRKWSIASANSR